MAFKELLDSTYSSAFLLERHAFSAVIGGFVFMNVIVITIREKARFYRGGSCLPRQCFVLPKPQINFDTSVPGKPAISTSNDK